MSSKAEKRRNKKAAQVSHGLPALAPITRKQPNGRTRRAIKQRDPMAETLRARASRWGLSSTRGLDAPWWGCEAGGAMAQATPDHRERERLWQAICTIRRVIATFDSAIGAPNRHAQSLRILLPSEEFSLDGSAPKDTRTDQEREDAAVKAYQWLGEILGRSGMEAETLRVVVDDQAPRDIPALLRGLEFVAEGNSGNIC